MKATSKNTSHDFWTKLIARNLSFFGYSALPSVVTEEATERDVVEAVILGDSIKLLQSLEQDPQLFFEECEEISDPSGQKFFNVSGCDLLDFFCNPDLFRTVIEYIKTLVTEEREKFISCWESCRKWRGSRGADLLFIAGPMSLNCDKLLKRTCYVDQKKISIPLLQNHEGIVCRLNSAFKPTWYHVDCDEKKINKIKIDPDKLKLHQKEYDAFVTSLKCMGTYKARCSSKTERELIQKLMRREDNMPLVLLEKGIDHEYDGISYCHSRFDFNQYDNAYLKCLELIDPTVLDKPVFNEQVKYEKNNIPRINPMTPEQLSARKEAKSKGNEVFRMELGSVQRKVLWLLEHYCCNKDYQLYNWIGPYRYEAVFNKQSNRLMPELGVSGAIYTNVKARGFYDADLSEQIFNVEALAHDYHQVRQRIQDAIDYVHDFDLSSLNETHACNVS